ncbi:hypothetical protein AAII07_19850 [Microvirga sp. 0TCS3.31]
MQVYRSLEERFARISSIEPDRSVSDYLKPFLGKHFLNRPQRREGLGAEQPSEVAPHCYVDILARQCRVQLDRGQQPL